MKHLLPVSLILLLSACGMQIPIFGGDRDTPAPLPAEPEVVEPNAADGAEVETLSGTLGTTLATLGDASVAGIWIETPLVLAPAAGRITAADGTSVEAQLIPSGGLEGAGSRLSLAAMQALGLSLTEIAEVTVEAL